jgi:osmotically-inducible protein OsmY
MEDAPAKDKEANAADVTGRKAPDDQGFDRKHQGAPRADRDSVYAGQSGYGGLSSTAPVQPGEHQIADRRKSSEGQAGGYGEGSYGGAAGVSDRGGLSSYGSSSGSRYLLDNGKDATARTANSAAAIPNDAVSESTERFGQTQPHRAPDEAQSHRNDVDVALHQKISDALADNGRLDLSDVSIAVADGIVTLQGTAPKRTMVQSIIGCIAGIPGVAKLDNQLTVRNEGTEATTFATGYTVGQTYANKIDKGEAPSHPANDNKPSSEKDA